MQSLESAFGKALHHPMPFTTGGQTITDRLTAAKHSLAGSQLGKTICKATTEELMAPKKKHCDYLLHCTNEPNVSIPSMANLLIERTQNPNWIVVYKALITIHNLMCYGNERFSQYLASCNTTINLSNFLDKTSLQSSAMAAGYDMSTHVRRYAKYISEKIHTYRLCAFDFCKVKRGRDDGLLRTMHADKLLKTLPILQNQIDALLEFQITSSELNNGVINCSFILLFRDLIRLFACYNDGVINLLEKFFDMNKKQCREALEMYKAFLFRLDKVSDFLRVAETVGIDRGEIPDLTRAPASLLEALEAHLYHLEGGKGPSPPTANTQQMVNQQIYQQNESFNAFASNTMGGGGTLSGSIDEMAKQKYLEEEKERLRQFEEQRQKQLHHQQPQSSLTNPFGTGTPAVQDLNTGNLTSSGGGNNDLLSFYDLPAHQQQTSNLSGIDSTNPFASALFGSAAPSVQSNENIGANPFSSGENAMIPPNNSQQQAADPFRSFPPNAAPGYSYNQGGPSLFAQQKPPIPQQAPFATFPQQQNSSGINTDGHTIGGIYDQTPFGPPSRTNILAENKLSDLVGNLNISNSASQPPQRSSQQPNLRVGPQQFSQAALYQPIGYSQMPQQYVQHNQSMPQQQQTWSTFGGGPPAYNVTGVGYGVQPQTSLHQPFSIQPNYGTPSGSGFTGNFSSSNSTFSS